jgi:hypothetical protein
LRNRNIGDVDGLRGSKKIGNMAGHKMGRLTWTTDHLNDIEPEMDADRTLRLCDETITRNPSQRRRSRNGLTT